ncbi:hypothetical protein K439DRAFT_1002332 [Ramaria rubella]|nr:hypothetical protein K439DRAFT_1002332 [Ramaria rubella]
MGRPLYTSILLSRNAAQVAQPEPPKPTFPVVEKWSRWNAFDPDSDEFFHPDNAVYEAFLTEEEIAERAQAQHQANTQLLAERLLREADSSTASLTLSEELDRSMMGDVALDMSQNAAVMERVVQEPDMDANDWDTGPNSVLQSDASPEGQQTRRQPRRAPLISEWRLSSTGDLSAAPVDAAVPSISVIPAGSRQDERTPSRPPSPATLVSGLQYLSDSPRPLIPVDTPTRPISPIPNTPARVSGVFATPPPSTTRVTTTPSPAPTVTPRILTWGSRPELSSWMPESPYSIRGASHPGIPLSPQLLTERL